MLSRRSIALVVLLFCALPAFAEQAPAGGAAASGPCQQIETACTNAGFKKGDWKNGDGLWKDCVDPIMHKQTSVPGGTKQIPAVDPNLVSQCLATHPNFGQGKRHH